MRAETVPTHIEVPLSPADPSIGRFVEIKPDSGDVTIKGAPLAGINLGDARQVAQSNLDEQLHNYTELDATVIVGGKIVVDGKNIETKGILPEAEESLRAKQESTKAVIESREKWHEQNDALDKWCKENKIPRYRLKLIRKMETVIKNVQQGHTQPGGNAIIGDTEISILDNFDMPYELRVRLDRLEDCTRLSPTDIRNLSIHDPDALTDVNRLLIILQGEKAKFAADLLSDYDTQQNALNGVWEQYDTAIGAYHDKYGVRLSKNQEIVLRTQEATLKKAKELLAGFHDVPTTDALKKDLAARHTKLTGNTKGQEAHDSSVRRIEALTNFAKLPIVRTAVKGLGIEYLADIHDVFHGKAAVKGKVIA